jgi:lipopolysaccharide/colanic/teichoic acid biosynthesis glycosyltransferase
MDVMPFGSADHSRAPAFPPLVDRPRRPQMEGDPLPGISSRPLEVVRHADRGARVAPDNEAVFEPRPRSEQLNRAVNLCLAVIALLVLSPIMLLVAVAVRLTSRGPILYTQTRIGLDRRRSRLDALYDRRMQDLGGHVFMIYKFRSMYMDAEGASGAVWATPTDPRVTPIGRILRKTRLDELPQLINVIKGDMNIVGPRPERPSIFARLRNSIFEYPLRQRIKPGITGWAQINHRYDATLDDVRVKVRYDLEYLRRQCLAEDVKIMLKTVPVVFFRKGGW